jgi:hypothetical protein
MAVLSYTSLFRLFLARALDLSVWPGPIGLIDLFVIVCVIVSSQAGSYFGEISILNMGTAGDFFRLQTIFFQ